mmetsp:Transcript_28936/g.92921  ORF Transcript_28936/g.92921 Transcript_28936/m.92921 type:complete len:252 (+) Transcript_28936:63-818(+)
MAVQHGPLFCRQSSLVTGESLVQEQLLWGFKERATRASAKALSLTSQNLRGKPQKAITMSVDKWQIGSDGPIEVEEPPELNFGRYTGNLQTRRRHDEAAKSMEAWCVATPPRRLRQLRLRLRRLHHLRAPPLALNVRLQRLHILWDAGHIERVMWLTKSALLALLMLLLLLLLLRSVVKFCRKLTGKACGLGDVRAHALALAATTPAARARTRAAGLAADAAAVATIAVGAHVEEVATAAFQQRSIAAEVR